MVIDPDKPTSMSLLRLAQGNDETAWDHLVHLYGPLVTKWCKRSGLKDDDAADVFQESFRAVAVHLKKFKPTKAVGSFRSWLKSIVRSKIADHYRKSNRNPSARGGTDAFQLMSHVPDPLAEEDEEEAENDQALVVQRAMELIQGEFNERNWAAFRRVALKGESATEVANELGVAPQTIRQANYRIRRRLRILLQDLNEET